MAMKTKIGQVTEEEKSQIKKLFDRKNGLLELAKTITAKDSDLYEKLVEDLAKTSSDFQHWWDSMQKKYLWESNPSGYWEIDFDTNNIYLNN
jgi:CXXX repeat modification system protein